MIVLAGADLVLPDRLLRGGSLIIDAGRIVAIEARVIDGPAGARRIDAAGQVIAPGFVDVHVHGVEGIDALDGPDAVAGIAARLPRFGVTAFCPTSVACEPAVLATLLAGVAAARDRPAPRSARVLPAHLESNFINPEWKGAQPADCLRRAPLPNGVAPPPDTASDLSAFSAADILAVIDAHRAHVGIVTLAPELPGGLDLVRRLARGGHLVSIGHTGATYDEAMAAIAAGARHATHLFNRMSPATARAPGTTGAVLDSADVTAEVICDGYHVHPTMVRLAARLKSPDRIMAITDGTAGSGLPVGTRARLGRHTIVVQPRSAELEDGTLAGSTLTMDGAWRTLVAGAGLSVVEAARLCATTPARQMGLAHTGALVEGFAADLVVLSAEWRVRQTYIAGVPALAT